MIVDVSVDTAGTSRQNDGVATFVSQELFTRHLSEDIRRSPVGTTAQISPWIGLTGIKPATQFCVASKSFTGQYHITELTGGSFTLGHKRLARTQKDAGEQRFKLRRRVTIRRSVPSGGKFGGDTQLPSDTQDLHALRTRDIFKTRAFRLRRMKAHCTCSGCWK